MLSLLLCSSSLRQVVFCPVLFDLFADSLFRHIIFLSSLPPLVRGLSCSLWLSTNAFAALFVHRPSLRWCAICLVRFEWSTDAFTTLFVCRPSAGAWSVLFTLVGLLTLSPPCSFIV